MTTQTEAVDTIDVVRNALAFQTPVRMAESFSGGQWRRSRHLDVIDWEFRNLLSSKDIDILIVKAPVRHGKTEYLGKWAPAWFMLRHPYKRLITTSATLALAKDNSRWIRDKVHELSPLVGLSGIDPGKAAAASWEIRGAGSCIAAGVGGSIMGFGADLFIIDDYCKNPDQALSQTQRDALWDWFTTVAMLRLSPTGKMVLMCTQWHEDDLIGRIMRNRTGLNLKVRCVTLQAVREENGTKDPLRREEGEALWPDQWPIDKLLGRRKIMAPYWWSSLFQGKPTSHDKNEWPDEYFSNIWCPEDQWPQSFGLSACYLDPSKGKESKAGDYQALVFVGYRDGKLYIDSDIDRRPVPRLMKHMAHFCKERLPAFVGVEANAFQDLLAGPYVEACNSIDYPVTEPQLIHNSVSKYLRIQRLGSWLQNRELVFRHTASNELLIQQLKAFPNGDHDDGCFVAGTMIDTEFGKVPIESVKRGDRVLTRGGYQRVLASEQTGIKPVLEVTLSDGRVLVGTENHPVFDGSKFVPLVDARKVLVLCEEADQWQRSQSALSTKAYLSGDIPMQNNGLTESISRHMLDIGEMESELITKSFGEITLGRYRRECKSIMSTEIRSITSCLTWLSSARRNTTESIAKRGEQGTRAQKESPHSKRLGLPQLLGINPRLEKSFIANCRESHGKLSRSTIAFASIVNANTKHTFHSDQSFAIRNAGMLHIGVLGVVGRRSISGKRSVFNLSVENLPEYFANGCLVHNCDGLEGAIRVLCQSFAALNERAEPENVRYVA